MCRAMDQEPWTIKDLQQANLGPLSETYHIVLKNKLKINK